MITFGDIISLDKIVGATPTIPCVVIKEESVKVKSSDMINFSLEY